MAQAHQPRQHPGQPELVGQAQPGRRGGELAPGRQRRSQLRPAPALPRPAGPFTAADHGRGAVDREGGSNSLPPRSRAVARLLSHPVVVAAGRHVLLQRSEVGPGAEAPAGPRSPPRPAPRGRPPPAPGTSGTRCASGRSRVRRSGRSSVTLAHTVWRPRSGRRQIHGLSRRPARARCYGRRNGCGPAALVSSWRTAVVTSEVQNGVLGRRPCCRHWPRRPARRCSRRWPG